ncbi:MAB_1171c family putative transporter [Dactylosporangium sp. AC04546]|uniref:MAB_1171c family putative transporter n=1 Tax=Dactylosporangium sp. AC04546 TaxID=2862460 RepID=UPI001EDD57E7|nr:MAB_1171c family putative transporter [Dactylosporangium sp. AC04546]WVK87470.1 MAB_1171c family putative transporter [Dactylosporangium sp. AC04546]
MDPVDYLEFTVLALLWGFTIWRFTRRQTPLGRAVRLVALLITISFTINRRELSYWTDQALHVADISVPLKNLATVGASAGMVHIVGLMSPDPDRHRRLRAWTYALLAAMSVAMVVLFLLAPRRMERWDFVYEQAGTPIVTAYACLTQLGLAVGLACAIALFRPGGRRAAPGALRTGLRLLSAGAIVGLLFMLNRIAFQLTNAAGWSFWDTPVFTALSRILLASMLLLFGAGAAVPAFGGLRRWLSHYLALQRLRPMWQELTTAVPGVVLGGRPGRVEELFAFGSVELRLYRRIIEIRDAQWQLSGGDGGPPAPMGKHDVDGEVRELLASRHAQRTAAQPVTAPPIAPQPAPQAARSVVATPVVSPGHNDPPDHPR